MKKLLIGLCAVLTITGVSASEPIANAQGACDQVELIMPGPADTIVSPLDGIKVTNSWNEGSFIKAQNINCGIPPIPPIGCRVGPCVCDQTGTRCQWTFVCG